MIRVLLCDPRREEWVSARAMLEAGGSNDISVSWEATVTGASQAIRSGKFDVCLVKDTFAGGRWSELVRYTTSDGNRIPVILFITKTPPDQGLGAIRDGASDVIFRDDLSPAQLERSILHTVARNKLTQSSGERPSIPPPESPSVMRHRLDAALSRARRGRDGVAVVAVHIAELVDAPVAHARPAVDIVAERIHSCMREVDTLSQVGAEFVLLVEDFDASTVAVRLARDLMEVMADPIELSGMILNITCSIGVASYPEDGEDAIDVFSAARSAMHAASEAGGRQYVFASNSLRERSARRLEVTTALEGALERGEFALHYQPQIELTSGELLAAEALLRWNHGELGQVSPAEFIPLLEHSGQIEAVEKWVIAEACSQAREWLDDGLSLRVNINLSARQFEERDVGTEIKNALETYDLSSQHLGLEITEGLLSEGTEPLVEIFDELRGLGIQVALDDFGTRRSALSGVKRYPIDVLKIDREFVRGLPDDTANAAITAAIVALGHSLGLTVIAEGIESAAAEEFLRSLGCHLGQGFHYAAPMPPRELPDWRWNRAQTG